MGVTDSEHSAGSSPSLEELFSRSIPKTLPNGDQIYELGKKVWLDGWQPQEVITTQAGLNVIKNFHGLGLLEKNLRFARGTGSWKSPGVAKEIVKGNPDLVVAIKPIRPWVQIDGVRLFRAIRALQGKGFLCAEPLFATQHRIVTVWESGKHPGIFTRKPFNEYLQELLAVQKNLENEGSWETAWMVDAEPSNFLIRNLHDPNIRRRFLAIDPVAHLTESFPS